MNGQDRLSLAFAAHATVVSQLEKALDSLDDGFVLLPGNRCRELILALRRHPDDVECVRLATELQVQMRDSAEP